MPAAMGQSFIIITLYKAESAKGSSVNLTFYRVDGY
jgi:hypothetical protein